MITHIIIGIILKWKEPQEDSLLIISYLVLKRKDNEIQMITWRFKCLDIKWLEV